MLFLFHLKDGPHSASHPNIFFRTQILDTHNETCKIGQEIKRGGMHEWSVLAK